MQTQLECVRALCPPSPPPTHTHTHTHTFLPLLGWYMINATILFNTSTSVHFFFVVRMTWRTTQLFLMCSTIRSAWRTWVEVLETDLNRCKLHWIIWSQLNKWCKGRLCIVRSYSVLTTYVFKYLLSLPCLACISQATLLPHIIN